MFDTMEALKRDNNRLDMTSHGSVITLPSLRTEDIDPSQPHLLDGARRNKVSDISIVSMVDPSLDINAARRSGDVAASSF